MIERDRYTGRDKNWGRQTDRERGKERKKGENEEATEASSRDNRMTVERILQIGNISKRRHLEAKSNGEYVLIFIQPLSYRQDVTQFSSEVKPTWIQFSFKIV